MAIATKGYMRHRSLKNPTDTLIISWSFVNHPEKVSANI
jgi:hypothetical protein